MERIKEYDLMPVNIRPTLNRIRGIPRKYPTVNRAIETAMRPGDEAAHTGVPTVASVC